MDENLIKEVDQIIEATCKCIKTKIKRNINDKEISEMTNALAALITARANAATYKINKN